MILIKKLLRKANYLFTLAITWSRTCSKHLLLIFIVLYTLGLKFKAKDSTSGVPTFGDPKFPFLINDLPNSEFRMKPPSFGIPGGHRQNFECRNPDPAVGTLGGNHQQILRLGNGGPTVNTYIAVRRGLALITGDYVGGREVYIPKN